MAKYPSIFRDNGPRAGFYIGPGWFTLVDTLCATIDWHIQNHVPEELRPSIFVAQVKEKFGTLRFYMEQSTPYIDGAIAIAEQMSSHICEQCGNPAKTRGGGWIKTECDSCHEESEKKKKK
jgi:hypothetical protein